VAELKTKGIENAGALLGGFVAWQNAGLPVDSAQPGSREPTQTPVASPSPAAKQTPKQTPKPAAGKPKAKP
jgi:3-mercaptopyruvate sulfurtransferase SseA